MNYLHGYGGLVNDTSGISSEEAIFSQACHLRNWNVPRDSQPNCSDIYFWSSISEDSWVVLRLNDADVSVEGRQSHRGWGYVNRKQGEEGVEIADCLTKRPFPCNKDTVTEKFTHFSVFVWNIFIRRHFTFNHVQFVRVHTSSFILVNKKKYI